MENNELIPRYMVNHFKDDDVRFTKLLEQAEIHGQHLSYFNKNLEEVKIMLMKQNEVNAAQYKEMKPVIDSYEETTKGIAFIKRKGGLILYISGFVITMSGAWIIIKDLFK